MKIGDLTVLMNLKKILHDSIDIEKVVIRDSKLNLLTDEKGNRTQIFETHDTVSGRKGISVTMASWEVQIRHFKFYSENKAKKNSTSFSIQEGRFDITGAKPVSRIKGEISGEIDSVVANSALILSKLPVNSTNLAFSMDGSTGKLLLEDGFFMVKDLKLLPKFLSERKNDGRYIDWSVSCENDMNAFLSIINFKKGKDYKQVNPDAKATLTFSQKGLIDALENPYTELDFAISGATIESTKMLYPVTDLFITGNYNNGESHTARSATIRIDTLHANIDDSFLDGSATVYNLKAPQIKAKLTANIDLQKIIKPTSLYSLAGQIVANIDINSKLDNLEKDGITGKDLASGEVRLQKLDIRFQDSLYRIQIDEGRLNLKDQFLIINRFNGTLNDEPFYLEGQLSDFKNLIFKENIQGFINAGFDQLDLGVFKPGNQPDTSSNRFMEFLSGHLSLAINTTIGKLAVPFGEMNNIDIQGIWEKSKLSIHNISLNYQSLNIHGDGFVSVKNDRLDSVLANAAVKGRKLDLEEMQDAVEALGSSDEKSKKVPSPVLNLNAKISLDTLLAGEATFFGISGNASNKGTSDINFDFIARKLEYGEITTDSIKFSGINSGNITEIKNCYFNYAGGRIDLAGVLRINDDQTITGNVVTGANSLDMQQLLSSFGNFGQSFLTGDNISGSVSWTADLYFRLDTNYNPEDDDNFWKFNFKVTDSRFSDVVPVEKALSFIRQKSKEDILVSNLEFSTFYVRDKLYFQDVAIKNSVSDMNIFGIYSPKDTLADIDLQISLSDLLFKSLKKRMIETEEGPVDVGNDKKLDLKFTGTMEQHRIKLIVRKELLKQRALMQTTFTQFDIELQKKISEIGVK